MVQSRTHTCNDLRMEHINQEVKLVGWMENVRVVSAGLAFMVLRDFYGATQIVLETEEIQAEDVLRRQTGRPICPVIGRGRDCSG